MIYIKNRNLLKVLIYFFLVPSFLYQNVVLAGISGIEVEWEPVGNKYVVPVSEDPDFIKSFAQLSITSGPSPKPFVEKFFTRAGLKNLLEEEGQKAVAEVVDTSPLKRDLRWGEISFIFVDPETKILVFHTHKTHRNSFSLFFDEIFTYDRDKTCQDFSRKWMDRHLTSLGLRDVFDSFLRGGYHFLRTASIQAETGRSGDKYLQFYAVFDKRKPGPQETKQSSWLRPHHFILEHELEEGIYVHNNRKYLSLVQYRKNDVIHYLQDLQKKCSPASSPQPSAFSSLSSSSSSSSSSSRRGSIIEVDPGMWMSDVSRLRINEDERLEFELTDSIDTLLANIRDVYKDPAKIETVDFSNGNPIHDFVIEVLIERWLLILPNLRNVVFRDNFFSNSMATSKALYELVSKEQFETLDVSGTNFSATGLDKFKNNFLIMKPEAADSPEVLEKILEVGGEIDDENVIDRAWRGNILRKFKLRR